LNDEQIDTLLLTLRKQVLVFPKTRANLLT
jgi:hypothetical protein